MYYFNTKRVIKKKKITSYQPISIVELLSFQINKVYIKVLR